MRANLLSLDDLARAWRLVIALIACQLVGAVLGVAYNYHHFAFLNLWAGGALGIAPGFVIGAIWHFYRADNPQEASHTFVLVGLICAFIFSVAVFGEIPRMRSDMKMLATLSRFDRGPIGQIEAFEEDRVTEIVTLSDPESVAAFARSITDAVGHSPSHPRYSHSWYLVIDGQESFEFELHLDPAFPDSVVGDSITRSENSIHYGLTFRSRALRPWVEKHLLRAAAAN